MDIVTTSGRCIMMHCFRLSIGLPELCYFRLQLQEKRVPSGYLQYGLNQGD